MLRNYGGEVVDWEPPDGSQWIQQCPVDWAKQDVRERRKIWYEMVVG